MAITDAVPAGAKNIMREAMTRAGEGLQHLVKSSNSQDALLALSEADVIDEAPRRRLTRRDVKLEVKGYLESVFRNRTPGDGSILEPSPERLMEDITDLFLRLEERTLYQSPQGPQKPVQSSGKPE